MGNPDNFVGGDRSGHPANLLGTVYKGGFVVGLILTLLFTVICLGIERFFAIKTASGKMNLAKFTADVKAAIKAHQGSGLRKGKGSLQQDAGHSR